MGKILFIFHKSYVNATPNFPRIFLAVRRNQVLGNMAPSPRWCKKGGVEGGDRENRLADTPLPEAGSSSETGSE